MIIIWSKDRGLGGGMVSGEGGLSLGREDCHWEWRTVTREVRLSLEREENYHWGWRIVTGEGGGLSLVREDCHWRGRS